MVSKKVKKIEKVEKKEKIEKNSNFWISLFILAIMVFSIIGFAIMSGGGIGNKSENGLPEEIPLQQFEQDGQVFWGAIRNSEQFIFLNIEGYDQALVEAGLANKIKSKENIVIYVDSGFTDSSSVYLVERALRGIKIDYSKTQTISSCNENVLVFTTNESFDSNCLRFVSSNEEAMTKADILVYHLIRQ